MGWNGVSVTQVNENIGQSTIVSYITDEGPYMNNSSFNQHIILPMTNRYQSQRYVLHVLVTVRRIPIRVLTRTWIANTKRMTSIQESYHVVCNTERERSYRRYALFLVLKRPRLHLNHVAFTFDSPDVENSLYEVRKHSL